MTSVEMSSFALTLSFPISYVPLNLMKIFRVMDERSDRFLQSEKLEVSNILWFTDMNPARRSKGSLQPDLMTYLVCPFQDVHRSIIYPARVAERQPKAS